MEKKFLSHLPARLVIGHRWYIIYYQVNPATGERERFRETFDLNRIPNLRERAKLAQQKLDELNRLLPIGYPFKVDLPSKGLVSTGKALVFAHKIKTQSDRPRTVTTYNSVVEIFTKWLKQKDLWKFCIADFSSSMAVDYMDYLVVKRKIGPRTYNNYLIRMKALFNALKKRDYIVVNPFEEIQKKKNPVKSRRTFTEKEKAIVANYIYKSNPQLLRIILLIYHCFIRPGEIRALRLNMFDFQNGTINIPASIAKNKRDRTVTIPDIIARYFYTIDFTKIPGNYLVFGENLQPNSNKQCGRNTMNYQHAKALKELVDQSALADRKGLSLYSWKDTGVTDASDFLSLFELMKQLGHTDPKVTAIYYQRKKVSKSIKQLKNKLI